RGLDGAAGGQPHRAAVLHRHRRDAAGGAAPEGRGGLGRAAVRRGDPPDRPAAEHLDAVRLRPCGERHDWYDRRTMRRVLLALLLLALPAPAADAKYVFIDLQARTFTPGELIESQIAGCRVSCGVELRGMPAVLIRAGTKFTDRCDVPRHAAGRLTHAGGL